MTHRRDRGRPRARAAHRRHVGLVHAGAAGHLRECRRRPGEHADRVQAAHGHRRARTPAALVVGPGEVRFRGRHVPLRARERRFRPPFAHGAAGREGRPRRPERRRQVDPRQPSPAAPRPRGRPDPDRRPGHCRRDAGYPARRDRRRHAGHLAAAPLDPGQHRLRPALGGRPSRSSRRSSSRMPRFHPPARGPQRTAGLRGACGRAGREALRRAAPAHRDRPGHPQGCADPGPRRGDLGARFGGRGGDPGGALDARCRARR